jgi:hypothetical protein
LDDEREYKLVKTIQHDEKDLTPVVVRDGLTSEKISAEDRKAYDEYFGTHD